MSCREPHMAKAAASTRRPTLERVRPVRSPPRRRPRRPSGGTVAVTVQGLCGSCGHTRVEHGQDGPCHERHGRYRDEKCGCGGWVDVPDRDEVDELRTVLDSVRDAVEYARPILERVAAGREWSEPDLARASLDRLDRCLR